VFASSARFIVAFAAVVATVSSAWPALAQTLPTPSPSTLTPPRLKKDAGVSYPVRALRERFFEHVSVFLIVEIDNHGVVRSARVTDEHAHGFDEAATEAAMHLEFEPAERDGTPIPSRIRFRYDFVPPPTRLVGRVSTRVTDRAIAGATVTVRDASGVERGATTGADGSWGFSDLAPGPIHVVARVEGRSAEEADAELSPGEETAVVLRLSSMSGPAAAPPVAAGEEHVEEVTVRGDRPPRAVTKRTLDAEEIAHIPGTNGDALKSLQNLPGVGLAPLFSGQLIVHGSAPQDTNIYVDGTNIALLYHFGGLSSVVPTELVDKIDFYPGNYSTAYGRGMGGVVDVGLRNPRKDSLHGLAQVDPIDARLLVEGPIADGWSFLAAARRSWFDVWLRAVLAQSGFGVSVAPRYYDYQAMVQKDLNSHSSLRALFLGSDDAFDIINAAPSGVDPVSSAPIAGELNGHTSFWRLQLRYDNKLSSETELRLTAAYGEGSFTQTLSADAVVATVHPLSGRAEFSQKLWRAVTAHVGLDVVYQTYDLDVQLPPAVQPGVPPGGPGQLPSLTRRSGTLFLLGTYAEVEVPWTGGRLVPGLRADYDDATNAWDISPRISARQDLASRFPRTTLKAGAGLFYQPPPIISSDPQDVQVSLQSGLTSSRSAQYDVGFEQEFTRQVDLSTDVFYKAMDRLAVAGAGSVGEGAAYGVEWLLRYKADERFFGWLSYTLSRSERRNGPGQPSYLFNYDQTHVLTVLGSYNLGRGWQVGARFRLVSGDPYTPMTGGAFDATVGAQQGVAAFPPFAARMQLFQQLDARVDKVWSFQTWKLSAYLDVQNVYIAKNPVGVTYSYNFTQSSIINGLPILPILGLRAEF
jgi:hypothetical protein